VAIWHSNHVSVFPLQLWYIILSLLRISPTFSTPRCTSYVPFLVYILLSHNDEVAAYADTRSLLNPLGPFSQRTQFYPSPSLSSASLSASSSTRFASTLSFSLIFPSCFLLSSTSCCASNMLTSLMDLALGGESEGWLKI
jgi:hypothetical protein